MATTIIEGLDGLKNLARGITKSIDEVDGGAPVVHTVGVDLGYSNWMEITQDRVNTFADATDDHQFIHVDPAAAAETPFGGTIAHGYLTSSLGPALAKQVYEITGTKMGVNYGSDKVRYITPVPVGKRLRLGVKLTKVEDIPGGAQVYMTFTYELEGAERPACVAENIYRVYF